MNEDTFKSLWLELRDGIQQEWSKLSDDDLDYINGDKEKLMDKLQELYGLSIKEAQNEFDKISLITEKSLAQMENEASSALDYMKENAQHFVRNSPFKALGIAALTGLLVGLRM